MDSNNAGLTDRTSGEVHQIHHAEKQFIGCTHGEQNFLQIKYNKAAYTTAQSWSIIILKWLQTEHKTAANFYAKCWLYLRNSLKQSSCIKIFSYNKYFLSSISHSYIAQ